MPLKIEWHGLRLHTVVFKLSRESEKRVLHTWTGGDFFWAGEGGEHATKFKQSRAGDLTPGTKCV